MDRMLKSCFGVLFAFLALAVFFSSADSGRAQPTECEITLTLVAPGAPAELEFLFTGEDAGGPFDFVLTPGVSSTGFTDFGPGFVTEIAPPGWFFDRIECEPGGGIEIISLSTGWLQECFNPALPTVCTVFNTDTAAIPTLSEWGMMAAAAGFLLLGAFYAARKRKAHA